MAGSFSEAGYKWSPHPAQEEFASSRAGFCAAKFTRQQSIIFQVDKPTPFFDVLPRRTFMAHPDFFQDALRSDIPREVRCMNPVQPKRLESKRQHGAGCFRRKTLSPVRKANPIAEFSALVCRRDH